jgi:hypothetical protein
MICVNRDRVGHIGGASSLSREMMEVMHMRFGNRYGILSFH